MANETLTFFCPACGIKLTVPSSLAGITGPCPTCRTLIQAPIPAAPPQMAPPAAAYQPPAPQPAYQPPPAPAVQAPAAIPNPPAYSTHAPQSSGPSTLKPEPRQLPNRPHPPEVIAKQMPEPIPADDSRRKHAAPVPRHPHRAGPLTRIAMLLLFLLASGALVYGVLKFLNQQPEEPLDTRKTAPNTDASEPVIPDSLLPAKAPATSALPTPPSEQPVIQPVPELPAGVEPKSPAMDALVVLEKFIAANSLAERLPMIETKTPEAELAASCLAGPLPPAPKMLLEFQESNGMEEVVDFYYNVDFELENNRLNPQTILVRTRGGANPKVVVDPFLDLFGGRLAAYAAKPSDKAGIFQVIVSALASCTDPKIPNREKKLTLKLLARDNTKEIAQAFFSRQSKIHEMLEDGTYSLSYGKAKSCTVMLRWNTEDSADYPYLEAIALKALDWNP